MNTYKKISSDEKRQKFITKAHNVWGYKYDYNRVEYKNSTTPVLIGYNGIFYLQSPTKHLQGKKIELHIQLMPTSEFVEKSKVVWGSDRFGYDKCVYTGTNNTVILYDNKRLKYIEQAAKSHLNGYEVVKYSSDDFVNVSNLIHDYKYTYENIIYEGNVHTRLDITCPEHGDFNQMASSHLNAFSKCPKCSRKDPESIINNFLKKQKIDDSRQHKYFDCMNNGYELPFDFYIPSKRLCIEFHSKYHDINNLDILSDDKVKKDYCEDNYITLLILNDNTNDYLSLIEKYIK